VYLEDIVSAETKKDLCSAEDHKYVPKPKLHGMC